jgi:putative transposase
VRTYRLVDQERPHHAVSLLCSVLAVSRQAYYAWRSRPPSTRELRDIELKALIVEVFDESRRTYGAPRIAKTLRGKRGQPVATKRIARLMGELGLQGLSRGGKGRGTTVQDAAARPAPDLLERDFTAAAPNLVWVADITYVRCYDGWLYLASVMDLFSRKIVGWSMRDTLEEPARFSVYRWVVRCGRGCGLRSGCVGRPLLASSCNSCASSFWRA